MSLPLSFKNESTQPEFLSGGGEMGRRIREFDWSTTPLGLSYTWPQSLKTCVRIMLTSPQPMFVWWGKETLVNIYNDAYSQILGQKHPQALGRSGKETWAEIWSDVGQRADIVFNKNEGTYDEALRLVMNRYGYEEETWFTFSYSPIPGDEGGTAGLFCACTEETQNIKAQKKVEASENRLRTIIETSPGPIGIFLGEDLRVSLANKPMYDFWQLGAEEALGRPLVELNPGLESQGYFDWLLKVFRNGEVISGEEVPASFSRADGSTDSKYFNLTLQPFKESDGVITGVLVTGTDVTGLVLARKRIEESESRFRTLAETLPEMIWVADEFGKLEYFSRQWETYSGIADPDEAWRYMVHSDDKERATSIYKNALNVGTSFRYDLRLKNKDGAYNWHRSIAEPAKDETGRVIKWVGSLLNIQDQKTLTVRLENMVAGRTKELAEANRNLQRSNEDLQQFAHVASHDLKEPVRKVMTFASRLRETLLSGELEESARHLSKIESSAQRMYSMIDGVLLYSSVDAIEHNKELIDLGELLQTVASDLEVPIVDKGAMLQYEGLPTVEGSFILLYQLFYNLVNNSLKFAQEGLPPTIVARAEMASNEDISKVPLAEQKNYVKINLQDNGIGFRSNYGEKIFGTFIRLHSKDKYEGTGLGLSLCKKIAERHGGTIWAEGKEGAGARFTIVLPAT